MTTVMCAMSIALVQPAGGSMQWPPLRKVCEQVQVPQRCRIAHLHVLLLEQDVLIANQKLASGKSVSCLQYRAHLALLTSMDCMHAAGRQLAAGPP